MAEHAQGTDGWRKERAGLLTASKFGAALGLPTAHSSRAELWRELTGRQTPSIFEPAVEYGTEHEPVAIEAYEVEMGNLVEARGFIKHPVHAFLGASPDGFIAPDGSLEVKCPFSDKPLPDVPPQHYLAQAYGVIECCERNWLHFVYWSPAEMRIWNIQSDPRIWNEIIFPKLEAFWQMILDDQEPGRMKKADKVMIPYFEKPFKVVRFKPELKPGEVDWPF